MSEHEELHDLMHAPEPDDDEPEAEPESADDEADEADEHEETVNDPVVEQAEQPRGMGWTPEEWEKRNRKAEQRFATYEAALQKVYEHEFDQLAPCPLCLGTTRGYVVKEAAGRVPEEQADLVKHFLGIARPVDYPQSGDHRSCDGCAGLGKVTTGSRVPGHETIPCPSCKGYGYTPPPTLTGNGNVPDAASKPLLSVVSEDIEQGDFDDWKQPKMLPDGRENPNYGKMPSYWIQVQPWGDTRGLTAQDAVTT